MRLIRYLVFLSCLAFPANSAEFTLQANYFNDREHPMFLGGYLGLVKWLTDQRADCTLLLETLTPLTILHISGRLEPGDSNRFEDVLAPFSSQYIEGVSDKPYLKDECPELVVTLDFKGGRIDEAIKIGRQINKYSFPTIIGPRMKCLSACLFVFAGGSTFSRPNMVIFSGGVLGLHKPQMLLTDNEKQIVKESPELHKLVYGLAGSTWSEISKYLVDELKNPYLFEALIDSPANDREFSFIDTYEEIFLSGIRLIDTRSLPNRRGSENLDPIADANRMMPQYYARHICALTFIKSGLRDDFSDSYAVNIGSTYIVGMRTLDKFCYINGSRACPFSRSFFDPKWESYPSWFKKWSDSASGRYPIWMFEDYSADRVEISSNDRAPTQQDRNEIAAFFEAYEDEICATAGHEYDISLFTVLPKGQRLDPKCGTPTKFCEHSEYLRTADVPRGSSDQTAELGASRNQPDESFVTRGDTFREDAIEFDSNMIESARIEPVIESVDGFKCPGASMPMDHVICADQSVYDVNTEHAQTWYKVRKNMGHAKKTKLVEDQMQWMFFAQFDCGLPARGRPQYEVIISAIPCIRAALSERINYLVDY